MAKTLEVRLDRQTNATLAEIYNSVSERKISKFSDHTTAVKRTLAVLEAAGKDITTTELGHFTVVDAGKAGRDGDDRQITVIVDSNPKGTGTKGRRRFDLYRTGMTVGQFVAGVRALGDCGSRREAIRQIAWDLDHGYISLG